MKTFSTVAVVVLVSAGGLVQDAQRPVFRAGTDVVTIDVAVRRRNGAIAGLSARDFELRDNGVVQSLTVQLVDAIPMDITLVLDQSHFAATVIRQPPTSREVSRIVSFLRLTDRLRIIEFGRDVREVFPLQVPTGFSWKDIAHLASTANVVRLFDALVLAMAEPADPERRHLIVALLGGMDRGSLIEASFLDEIAARTDALLHVAAPWMLASRAGQYGMPREVRHSLVAITGAAEATGGRVHDGNGADVFKEIFEEFRQSYVLRYTLTGVPADGQHAIVVRVPTQPEAVIRARPGYVIR